MRLLMPLQAAKSSVVPLPSFTASEDDEEPTRVAKLEDAADDEEPTKVHTKLPIATLPAVTLTPPKKPRPPIALPLLPPLRDAADPAEIATVNPTTPARTQASSGVVLLAKLRETTSLKVEPRFPSAPAPREDAASTAQAAEAIDLSCIEEIDLRPTPSDAFAPIPVLEHPATVSRAFGLTEHAVMFLRVVALFVMYATFAGFRWLLHGSRLEWARASERARSTRRCLEG